MKMKLVHVKGLAENYMLDLTDPKRPILVNLKFKDKDGNPRPLRGCQISLSVEKKFGGYIHYSNLKDENGEHVDCFLHQLILAAREKISLPELRALNLDTLHDNRCRWDNSDENISLGTHTENMNNPGTRDAISKHKRLSILLLNKGGSNFKAYFSYNGEVVTYLAQQGINLTTSSVEKHCKDMKAVKKRKDLVFVYTKDFITSLLKSKKISRATKIRLLKKLENYMSEYEKVRLTDYLILKKELFGIE